MPIQVEIPDHAPVTVRLLAGWGQMAEQALFGDALLLAGLAGLAAQCALIALVLRRRHAIWRVLAAEDPAADLLRRTFSVWPELLSALLLVLPLIIEGVSLYLRLRIVAAGLQPADPSQPATLLSAGVKERYYGPVLASLMVAIQALPAAVVIVVGTCYRLRLRGVLTSRGLDRRGPLPDPPPPAVISAYRDHPGPAGAFLLTLGLAAGGAIAGFFVLIARFAADLIETFSGVAVVDPAQKKALLLMGVGEAEALLQARLVVVAAILALLAVGAFVHLHWFSAAAQRHRIAPELPRWPRVSNRRYVVALALCLGGAALALRLAWPFYQERRQPPPRTTPGADRFHFDARIDDPQVEGADALRPGPVLQIEIWDKTSDEGMVTFEAQEVAGGRLEQAATRHRELLRQIDPGAPFTGLAALRCDRRIRLSQLQPHLRTLRRAGYQQLQLVFTRTERVERPLLGRFPVQLASAARVRLVGHPPAGLRVLEPAGLDVASLPRGAKLGLRLSPGARYDALARAVVAARTRGNQVLLVLGAEKAPPQVEVDP